MPVCQQCETEWTWWETHKASANLDTRLVCPHCHGHQYASKDTLKKTSVLTLLIPLLIIFPSFFFNLSIVGLILHCLTVITLFFIFYPFILKLSSTEEHLVNWGKIK
ncbi:CXXC-20-CXXC protein [Alkalibacillus filiformis]|uniref:CXXC-20-CXXC protein n=1 Tax=Alkalibacillus filiformis TaxID=200990 RepID=A0ABU0DSY1_9BACI|nr:TIGR04104 family putative zinc finger protein [Alkalibacillus filiformis]MDQ0351416.1 CXXC-20-CXXC protein [Alkalibacillus filiformis]